MWQLFIQFSIVLFLVVAVAGLGVGAGLIISSQKTVEFFHVVNRWVSTRHVLRPVELPVDTERATHRHHRWLAGGFVLGGLISGFGLLAGLDATAVSATFAERRFAPVVAIAVESAKWVLIVGSAFGVAVGAMLLLCPNAESALENFANRWVSPRRVTRGWDDMHMNLDRLVEAHPKPAGWTIACTSAAGVIFGLIVLTRYY
jgi:drug/metabolite transporter (DMT)-like permease